MVSGGRGNGQSLAVAPAPQRAPVVVDIIPCHPPPGRLRRRTVINTDLGDLETKFGPKYDDETAEAVPIEPAAAVPKKPAGKLKRKPSAAPHGAVAKKPAACPQQVARRPAAAVPKKPEAEPMEMDELAEEDDLDGEDLEEGEEDVLEDDGVEKSEEDEELEVPADVSAAGPTCLTPLGKVRAGGAEAEWERRHRVTACGWYSVHPTTMGFIRDASWGPLGALSGASAMSILDVVASSLRMGPLRSSSPPPPPPGARGRVIRWDNGWAKTFDPGGSRDPRTLHAFSLRLLSHLGGKDKVPAR